MKTFPTSSFIASGFAALFLTVATSVAEVDEPLHEDVFMGGGDSHYDGLWAPNAIADISGTPVSPVAGVPEPGSASLLLLGAGLLGMARNRTRATVESDRFTPHKNPGHFSAFERRISI